MSHRLTVSRMSDILAVLITDSNLQHFNFKLIYKELLHQKCFTFTFHNSNNPNGEHSIAWLKLDSNLLPLQEYYWAEHSFTNQLFSLFVAFTKREETLTVLFVSHAQDNFWGSVVSSHHIRGHHEACASSPGQTEVQDLQGAVWFHHYIAWFEVLDIEIIQYNRNWFEKQLSTGFTGN